MLNYGGEGGGANNWAKKGGTRYEIYLGGQVLCGLRGPGQVVQNLTDLQTSDHFLRTRGLVYGEWFNRVGMENKGKMRKRYFTTLVVGPHSMSSAVSTTSLI